MKLQRPDPGIDAAKSGLHGKAGIFFNAGLFSKGGGFNPLDLDPYLLFDARTSMIGTLENPTLDLDPSKQDTLDVITATRAGVATYTDINGNIATAPANTVRVDQTQGAELTPTKFQRVNYTDFSSGWVGQAGVTFEAVDEYENQPVRRVIYDGVTTGGIYQTIVNTVGGVSYTGSFYARRISGSNQIYIRHGFSASGNQTILPVTTEWQKFSVTILGASGGGNVYFGIIQFSAGDDVYEITQPQFEEGTTASDFVENTTGSPKFITGATYGPRVPMILVEPSAINLVDYSEDFTHSSWLKQNVTVSAAPVSAPDGTMTATHVVKVTSEGHLVKPSIVTNGSDRISIWAKTVSGSGTVFFNYHTGTPSTVTDQWQRFEVTANAAHVYAVNFRGSSTLDELYIWGAQGEAGSVSTSYIPTSGGNAAARTRAADNLEITGSAFTDFYNQSEGTFYVESELQRETEVGFEPFLFDADNGDANRVLLYNQTAGDVLGLVKASGAGYAINLGTHPSVNTLSRTAFSYKSNNLQGSKDGNSVTPITTAVIPSTINTLNVGSHYTKAENLYLNGRIRRLIFWPYHSDSL
jgi:hypothetical protein